MSAAVFEEIRTAAAEVARRARSVRIDRARLEAMAPELARAATAPVHLDPAHHPLSDPESTLAYVLTLDAINFGSGWFPTLAKLPGCSGYFTVAKRLKQHFEARGPWSASELQQIDTDRCIEVFGQDEASPGATELMSLFARALRELGACLANHHGGRFEALVAAADRSAAKLVALLARMPFYRDVSRYEELRVPLYKRAQLSAADLSVAFEGRGPGEFHDLSELTIFADNLVPHVLRCDGALVYDEELVSRIEAGTLIEPGSLEEIEIRAVALHAVEEIRERLAGEGIAVTSQRLDTLLWNRGQRPELKARPRHRARSVYY